MADPFRSDPKRAAELAVILATYAHSCGADVVPHKIADLVVTMQKAARSAKRQAENACNYPMSEEQQDRADKRQARAQDKINAALVACMPGAQGMPPSTELGGDPRGPCARLHIPGQRGDGWGDGFAIY